jgi:hypothetical protein
MATRKTIVAMQAGGRLEDVDAVMVGLAQVTADLLDEAVDARPFERSYAIAALGRLHLQTLTALTAREPSTADADFASIVAALSPPLAYPEAQKD